MITSDDALVHSSGHPRQDELKTLYNLLKPRALVPMHGEPRHLYAHAKFAKKHGIKDTLILEDGKISRLCPGPLEVVDEVSCGVLHVDGKLIVPGQDGPAKQRRKLSHVGIIIASVLIDDHLALAEDVEISIDGVPAGFEEELSIAAEKAFESMGKPRRKDTATVEETVRVAIRRCAEMTWGKKPIVKVIVTRV